MTYKLIIKDLKIMATHGILESEKIKPQEFLVNMILETEFDFEASKKDELPPSKCYGLIREYIIKYFTENKHNTLEKISLNICEYVLSLNIENKKISFSIINTKYNPEECLSIIKNIISEMGRIRTFQNAPRIIDIDISLIYNFNYKFKNEKLEIPHPKIYERGFVTKPLIEMLIS